VRLLLPTLRDLLKMVLVEPPARVRTVDCRPNAWIEANLGATKYPAVFIWGDSDEIMESSFANDANRVLRVAITCLHHSSDPNFASFDPSQGVYGLIEAVLNVIAANKKLRTAQYLDGVVRGWSLPIRISSIERTEGTAFIVGTVAILEFYRDSQVWTSSENDDLNFISQ